MDHKRTIGYEFRNIHNLISNRCDRNMKKNNHDLTPMQAWTIGFLFDHSNQELYQKDVEAEFTISRATATNMLQSMERKRLIVREPVDHDGRLKKIMLTDLARSSHEQAMMDMANIDSLLIKNMTMDEILELERLLQKVHLNLEENKITIK